MLFGCDGEGGGPLHEALIFELWVDAEVVRLHIVVGIGIDLKEIRFSDCRRHVI